MKFKKGMILAVNVIPSESADTGQVMIIDTAKLSNKTEEERNWLKAMKEELEKDLHPETDGTMEHGQQTYPEDWDTLEKAEIKTFPVQIDGAVDLFYGVD